jgi:hypothetical protein
MSSNSYSLSKAGGRWVCEGTLESGRAIRFDCGAEAAPEAAAAAVAELRWKQRLQQSAASKSRWAKHAAGGSSPATAPATSAAAAARNARIRERLVGVGDGKPIDPDDDDDAAGAGDDGDATDPGGKKPIEPDSVHDSPDDAKSVDADDEEEGGDDGEAAEILADVIGTGIYNGLIVGGTTKLLKRAKPPKRPGEPHELFVRYSQEGLCFRVRKLIGKDAKLGPNGKLFVGLAGTIVTMLWNAEDLEPEAAPAAAPAPAAPRAPREREAAVSAAAHAADQKPRTELRLVRPPAAPAAAPGSTSPAPPDDSNPIGTFR